MKKVKINDKELAELKRINESVPKEMKDRLIIKRNQIPTVNKVVSLALHDPDVPQKQKDRLKHLKEAGHFNLTSDEVNKTAQKEIDEYLNTEIAKSIVAGRLPQPKDNKLLDKYIKKCRKKAKKS